MKKVVMIIFALLMIVSLVATVTKDGKWVIFHWKGMNYERNVISDWVTNLNLPKVSNIPDFIKKRLENKINNHQYQTIEYAYGDSISNAIMIYSNKFYWPDEDYIVGPHKVGSMYFLIERLNDTKNNVVWRYNPNKDVHYPDNNPANTIPGYIPIYANLVLDTLRYEENPTTASYYGARSGQSVVFGSEIFKDGLNGVSQCNNAITFFSVIDNPRPKPKPEPVIQAPTPVEIPTIVMEAPKPPEPIVEIKPKKEPCPKSKPIFDVWLNSSYTNLQRPPVKEIISPVIEYHDIKRNYDPNKTFDIAFGGIGQFFLTKQYSIFGKFEFESIDRALGTRLFLGMYRHFYLKNNDLSFGLSVNPVWQEFQYWEMYKTNIISPNEYTLISKEQKPWIESVNFGLETKIANKEDYALMKGSIDPKCLNNSAGIELNVEHKLFVFALGNYELLKSDKLIDHNSIVTKPKRTNYLGELKLGINVGKKVFIFVDGRQIHKNTDQVKFDEPYKYKYVRTDFGPGIRFPFMWDKMQFMLSYVDIKDDTWHNYGWCIRMIWDIK